MSSFNGEEITVARDVKAVAEKFAASGLCNVPVLAHLAITRQESGWKSDALNADDPNGSYGPYQINQQAHANTAQLAISPWADFAFYIMAAQWEQEWTPEIEQLWTNPATRGLALEKFAPAAQGSVAWPQGLGDMRYSEALQMLELLS